MNRNIVAFIAAAALMAAAPAFADGGGRGHGGYHGGHGNGHYGHYRGHGGYGYKGYRYAGYGTYWRGYRPYRYAPYYGYYNNNDNDEAAYLVGGLVVGSLLTNAYYRSQQTPVYTTQTVVQPAPVVVQSTQVVVQGQGRRLLRDLNGDCFERTTDAAGNELRTQLPASECNW